MLVGVDVGGTFTDLVWSEDGQTYALKVPTTPQQEEGFLQALDMLREVHGDHPTPARLVHGTTVATNTVLEGTWSPTALFTTKGFRDVLEIGRQARPALYDLFTDRPQPVVPRSLRVEVPERLDHRGRVVRPLDETEVRRLARQISGTVSSVAVVLLYAFLNDRHERRVRAILREEGVEVPITLSSEVLPEFREFERTSTTVLAAALRPVIAGYLERLVAGLRERSIDAPLLLMSSSGGVVSADEAARSPAVLLLSGPAGGVEGARRMGAAVGLSDMITLDMGGTSTDVALLPGGVPQRSPEREVAGHPVRVPAVDVHTVGAGGGSIAHIDAGGALRVGPLSAGAVPGPACYGHGGSAPTVTDAHLVLGRLPEDHTLGGLPPLDLGAARSAVARVARPLGLSVDDAAWGILTVAEATMERAVRVISVERGHDPRGFTLLAFGGAGPLHGASLAAKLGMRKVLVPAHAGALSALGLMSADLMVTLVRSVLLPWAEARSEHLQEVMNALNATAARRLSAAGVPAASMVFRYAADLRYRGQGFELTVPWDTGDAVARTRERVAQDFHNAHEARYGYAAPEEPLELVTLRLTATAPTHAPPLPLTKNAGPSPTPSATRPVYLGPLHGWATCPVVERRRLCAGAHLPSPAVVEGADCTCLIPPEVNAQVDAIGNLVLEVLPWTP